MYKKDPEFLEPTLKDEIIALLLCARSNSLRKHILWERVKKRRDISRASFDMATSRLRKNGLISLADDGLHLSGKGKIINKYSFLKSMPEKNGNIILMFDIPESKRRTRKWLRDQLKIWDFEMIQKSVWMGPGPLSKEFKDRLRGLGVENCVKVFSVTKKKQGI